MSNLATSWQDRQGVDGFGVGTQADVDSLNKALSAGNDINNPGASAGEGFPLRVESLESTLKHTTFRMEHIRLWKSIPKLQAYNTVEEYNIVREYGSDEEAWIAEGGLPKSEDTTYERAYAKVKYLGVTRQVTHVMSLIKPAHGNVIAQETVSGTMYLLRRLEKALFSGDSALSDLQFDGFSKLIQSGAPANVIDLRGAPLDEDVLQDAALTVMDAPNYGVPSHLHVGPKVVADLAKSFFPKERYDLFKKDANGNVGLNLGGFTSVAGDVKFEPNVFISDEGPLPVSATGDAALRPATHTNSTGSTTPPNAASQFGADDAGDYLYYVVASNNSGRAAPVQVDGALITVAAGDQVSFGVTPGAANSPAVLWWELYRTAKDGTDARRIRKIPNVAGAGETTIIDRNEDLPFTSEGFMFQQNIENMSFKQLAPFVKIPLATVDTSIRFMMLLYGVPVLYTPQKNVLFKNIGRSAGFVGAP